MSGMTSEEAERIYYEVRKEFAVKRQRAKKALDSAREPGPTLYRDLMRLSVELECWRELHRAAEYGLLIEEAVERGVAKAKEVIKRIERYTLNNDEDVVKACNAFRIQVARDFIHDVTTPPE